MDPILESICQAHGVFLRSEAADLGYDDRAVSAMMRARLWHRVRRGAYTFKATWESSTPEQRHLIHCRAVQRSLADSVALSHVSALIMHGVPVWGIDLDRVHVTRLDGATGGNCGDVVQHVGGVVDGDLESSPLGPVVGAARAVVESLTLTDVERGLVIADGALHQGLATEDSYRQYYQRMSRWPSVRSAQLVLRLADGRAASPGETRVRFACWQHNIERPELQHPVYDGSTLVGIADFLFERLGLLGEFDGRVKYGRLLRPGQSPGDAVFEEKVREDKMRAASGLPMVRFIWTDFSYRRSIPDRIMAASDRSRPLRGTG